MFDPAIGRALILLLDLIVTYLTTDLRAMHQLPHLSIAVVNTVFSADHAPNLFQSPCVGRIPRHLGHICARCAGDSSSLARFERKDVPAEIADEALRRAFTSGPSL